MPWFLSCLLLNVLFVFLSVAGCVCAACSVLLFNLVLVAVCNSQFVGSRVWLNTAKDHKGRQRTAQDCKRAKKYHKGLFIRRKLPKFCNTVASVIIATIEFGLSIFLAAGRNCFEIYFHWFAERTAKDSKRAYKCRKGLLIIRKSPKFGTFLPHCVECK